MKNKLMTHVVAGYPTYGDCIELLLGMQRAEVVAIEVQIPFSDPCADGPVIMRGNDIALQNGMSTEQSFALIRFARTKGLTLPIYVMSYVNKLHYFGLEKFCQETAKSRIQGLIVPDLPFDTPEYKRLLKSCQENDLQLIPVIAPGISKARLKQYLASANTMVYLSSTKGITGNNFVLRQQLLTTVKNIRSLFNGQIALGFGINGIRSVKQAVNIADVAVVGSAVIEHIDRKDVVATLKYIKSLVGN